MNKIKLNMNFLKIVMTDEKIQNIELEIIKTKDNISTNINNVIDRGEKLEQIEEKAEKLENNGEMFYKQAKKTRWKMFMAKVKANAMLLAIICIILLILFAIFIPIFTT